MATVTKQQIAAKKIKDASESEIVARLFKMYQELTK